MKHLFKLILILMSILLNVSISFSQTISSDVISNSGETFIAGKINLNWTLGETVTDIHENGKIIHTQGFHQTFILNTPFSNKLISKETLLNEQLKPSISVYPNPTRDILNVKFINVNNNVSIELYDMAGQKLFNKEVTAKVLYQLNMKPYSDGSYLLNVINDKKTVFQIIKSSK